MTQVFFVSRAGEWNNSTSAQAVSCQTPFSPTPQIWTDAFRFDSTPAPKPSILTRMKVCVIFNPAARGEKAKQFRDRLAALSTRVELKPTYAAGTGRALAAEAVREGFKTIVAAGGDGTLNEVVNGLADEPEGLARTRLGGLPLGTLNVFARE